MEREREREGARSYSSEKEKKQHTYISLFPTPLPSSPPSPPPRKEKLKKKKKRKLEGKKKWKGMAIRAWIFFSFFGGRGGLGEFSFYFPAAGDEVSCTTTPQTNSPASLRLPVQTHSLYPERQAST